VRDETPSFRQTSPMARCTEGSVSANAVAISAFVFPATTAAASRTSFALRRRMSSGARAPA